MVRVGLVLLSLLLVQSANAGSLITSKYDKYFKESAIFLPVGTDWRLLKAQCYQESRLNPFATSPVGATGLCQFMPNTSKELQKQYPELTNFWLPEVSIRAAAIYMNRQYKIWRSPRPFIDRYMLALASYNAGAGNVINAQKKVNGAIMYKDIINGLESVTGKHSVETINYVKLIIGKWYVVIIIG